ncbi:MAG: YihY/virulence factor BrkB family protein [Kiritimatiellae bacterium]|nr:YihY/virulence factor BrkB family protein [Kiritimatiellia bacterium]
MKLDVDKLKRFWRFLKDEIWDIELSSLSTRRRFGISVVRVVQLVFRGFIDDACPLHASALTFNTLMAIVPVLALSLAVARGLGAGGVLESRVRDFVAERSQNLVAPVRNGPGRVAGSEAGGHAGVESADAPAGSAEWARMNLVTRLDELVTTTFEYVGRINFTALGGVGLALLIWMVIGVLGRVEFSFNKVWGIASSRSLLRKFSDYLSTMVILPVLIIAATSLPVADLISKFVNEQTAEMIRNWAGRPIFKNLTVLLMTCVTFTFLIKFMPNTRVRIGAGFAGGLVSGILFILWMWLCARLQIGVLRNNIIYGSFAMLPIVLAWVYVSWEIVLLGAEVAFAVQNCSTYVLEQRAQSASVRARFALAVALLARAGEAMLGRKPNLEIPAYADEKLIPVRLLHEVVEQLRAAQMLVEVSEEMETYVLGKAAETVTIKDIWDVVVKAGGADEAFDPGHIDPRVREVVGRLDAGVGESFGDARLRDLLAEPQPTA